MANQLFSAEFKREAVRLRGSSSRPITQLALELGALPTARTSGGEIRYVYRGVCNDPMNGHSWLVTSKPPEIVKGRSKDLLCPPSIFKISYFPTFTSRLLYQTSNSEFTTLPRSLGSPHASTK